MAQSDLSNVSEGPTSGINALARTPTNGWEAPLCTPCISSRGVVGAWLFVDRIADPRPMDQSGFNPA